MADITFKVEDLERLPRALQWMFDMACKGLAAGPVLITLGRPERTTDQNSKLWPMLTDISAQVEWFGQKHSKEDWKDILSAAWKGQKLVPGINGGFVALGVRTSKISIPDFSEFIESIYAFGADKEVRWSEPALKSYEQYGRQRNEAAA